MDTNALRAHIQGLANNDPDVRCFNKDNFDACYEIWKTSKFKNDKIRQRLFEIATNSPERGQLEILMKNPYYTLDRNITNKSTEALQKVYRSDAKKSGNTEDLLKSFQLQANDEDAIEFIKKSPLQSVFNFINTPSFKAAMRRNHYRDLAQEKFINSKTPDGYFYAYKTMGNTEHLNMAVSQVSKKHSPVADDIIATLFERDFSRLEQVEDFSKAIEQCQGCSRSRLYALVPRLNGFRTHFQIDEFLQTKEFKYHFSKVPYTISQNNQNSSFEIIIKTPSTSITLTTNADCSKGKTYTTNEPIGLLEKIGTILTNRPGEYISGREIEKQTYNCELDKRNKEIVTSIASKSTGSHDIKYAWNYESDLSTKYVWSPIQSTDHSSNETGQISSDYCGSDETCFTVNSTHKTTVTIQCTKGIYRGQTQKICGPNDKGKWASGCGFTDTFAYHHTFVEAGNRACGK